MTTTILIVLAAVILPVNVVLVVISVRGERQIRHLNQIPQAAGEDLPKVAIVVAARNEERSIRESIQSLLKLDYPHLEITVVNDRSSDQTEDILRRMNDQERRLKVVHVRQLPSGWLGKNYALYRGASQVRADLLLFTDADVIFHRSALRRAVNYFRRQQLDHLAITPAIQAPSALLKAFVTTFTGAFKIYFRPWQARNPKSRAHIGIGAFNLIRADAYWQVGGHRAIAMRPDDDLKLGKIIKQAGFRQDLVHGPPLLRVTWYHSIRELIRGLEKNTFAGVEYSIAMTVASSVLMLLLDVLPYVAVFGTAGIARALYALCACVLWGHAMWNARQLNYSRWCGLLFPVAVGLFVYIQWRTMLLTLRSGGVRWRDTLYPLSELKANRV